MNEKLADPLEKTPILCKNMVCQLYGRYVQDYYDFNDDGDMDFPNHCQVDLRMSPRKFYEIIMDHTLKYPTLTEFHAALGMMIGREMNYVQFRIPVCQIGENIEKLRIFSAKDTVKNLLFFSNTINSLSATELFREKNSDKDNLNMPDLIDFMLAAIPAVCYQMRYYSESDQELIKEALRVFFILCSFAQPQIEDSSFNSVISLLFYLIERYEIDLQTKEGQEEPSEIYDHLTNFQKEYLRTFDKKLFFDNQLYIILSQFDSEKAFESFALYATKMAPTTEEMTIIEDKSEFLLF